MWGIFSESPVWSQTCLTLVCGLTRRSDYLLLARTRQIVTEILPELRHNLELKSSELTTKPTRYLGRTLVRTKEGYNFGSDASCVQDMLEEFNMSALESTPALRWNRREADEKDLPASAENCCGLA